MAVERELDVEVVLARADAQRVVRIRVPVGTTAGEAVRRSGLLAASEAVRAEVGIYGRRVEPDTPLCPGDRVEIYRPLKADPKQARRRRAVKRR